MLRIVFCRNENKVQNGRAATATGCRQSRGRSQPTSATTPAGWRKKPQRPGGSYQNPSTTQGRRTSPTGCPQGPTNRFWKMEQKLTNGRHNDQSARRTARTVRPEVLKPKKVCFTQWKIRNLFSIDLSDKNKRNFSKIKKSLRLLFAYISQ